MHKEVAVLLGHADVGILILHGYKFTVPGGTYGVQKSTHIHSVAIRFIETDLAAVQTVLIDRREDLFREFERHIDADRLVAGVGIGDANMQPAVMAGNGGLTTRSRSRRGLGRKAWCEVGAA